MKNENEFSFFCHNIISNGLIKAIRNNIVTKRTTELVLLFHKNITQLIFLRPNMGQKSFKVFTKFISKMHNFVELKESYTINISRFNNICCLWSLEIENQKFLESNLIQKQLKQNKLF